MCFTEEASKKLRLMAYRQSGGKTPRILNLNVRQILEVTFMFQQITQSATGTAVGATRTRRNFFHFYYQNSHRTVGIISFLV